MDVLSGCSKRRCIAANILMKSSKPCGERERGKAFVCVDYIDSYPCPAWRARTCPIAMRGICMPIYPYEGKHPTIGTDCYIAPTATLIGDVTLHDGVSVWFGAVLRGDVAPITVGARSNLQDLVVVHGEDGSPTIIGEDVTVGHSAIIHAAIVGDRVLVGMGAVLLSRCRIGSDTIIGARALVTEEVEISEGSLVLGVPAKVKRATSEIEREGIKQSAQRYIQQASIYGQAKLWVTGDDG